jgi:hypothetical protein
MAHLAQKQRYEEAALVRDRLRAIAEALRRARQDAWLVGAGRLALRETNGRVLRLNGGALGDGAPIALPCPRDRADELSAVRSWLGRNRVGIDACDRPPTEPVDGGAAIASILQRVREAEAQPRSAAPGQGGTTPAG